MATIFDVAKYILKNLEETTNGKLHKLCYYSQAWTLAWGEPALFDEDFQAWSGGPVCPELYSKNDQKFTIRYDDLQVGNETALSETAIENINMIVKDYGETEPYDLIEESTNEDPWKLARNGLTREEPCETVITKESMKIYYGGL
ncbi:MAG: DUF4065 domain-containing protein [Firmicutes bacterium]|nr:DUF4065 domain-containing protein [Bacillota bacterium]